MKKTSLLITVLFVLPILLGSCAQSFSDRKPVKKATEAAAKGNATELYAALQDPTNYYVMGEMFSDDGIGNTTLLQWLRTNKGINIDALWIPTTAAKAKAIFISLVVPKATPNAAKLFIGISIDDNDTTGNFIKFVGTLDKDLADGATVTFTGKDSMGFATFTGTYKSSNMTTKDIVIDGTNLFSASLILPNMF